MQHRDKIVLEKIISEIDVADELIGDDSLTVFLDDEKLKSTRNVGWGGDSEGV